MTTYTSLQLVDLWEAWIEFDPVAANYFGTLFITGEVLTNGKKVHIVKGVHEDEPHTLVLRICTTGHTQSSRLKEVIYSEKVKNISRYSSIKVYQNDELISYINDIEVIV